MLDANLNHKQEEASETASLYFANISLYAAAHSMLQVDGSNHKCPELLAALTLTYNAKKTNLVFMHIIRLLNTVNSVDAILAHASKSGIGWSQNIKYLA